MTGTTPRGSLLSRVMRLRTTRSLVRVTRTTVGAQGRELKRVSAQLERQVQTLDRLVGLEQQLAPLAKAADVRALEHGRFSHQIGGMEQRLGALEQRISDGRFVADDADEAQARRLVDEIRREHEQIRVRMQIISSYEERLRRVEATAAELYDGDLRHQV